MNSPYFWIVFVALSLCQFAFGTSAVKVVDGFDEPVCIACAPGDSSRLFVVERTGRIRIVDLTTNTIVDQPLLDIGYKIETGFNEQGLLGLAFAPDWQTTRSFFVNYTRKEDGATVVARYLLTIDASMADTASAKVLFEIDQPYANHNGGGILFGPDGQLYIGMGDGGSAGDPHDNAQNDDALLGKMLTLDVAAGTINLPNQFLKGLRNPWRFDFDPATNDLYIADVGQNTYEEVHVIPAGKPRNDNLGWNNMEGRHCFPIGDDGCNPDDFDLPVWEY